VSKPTKDFESRVSKVTTAQCEQPDKSDVDGMKQRVGSVATPGRKRNAARRYLFKSLGSFIDLAC
jgi:hypothetical protein